MCSALFSSISRLLNHNQIIICDKCFCNHCEKVFDFKNKFHNYIRSHECQKRGITYLVTTSISAAKSIAPYKFNLSTFVFVESIVLKVTIIIKLSLSSNSFFTYRAISPLFFIYKPYKKSYLTIADLYMRYVSLSKPSFIIIRIIIMLSIMFMQNLYKKFYNKKKLVIFTNKSFKQYATLLIMRTSLL